MRKILLPTALLFCLSACSWNPGFMPKGFKYSQNEYKAAPGPQANDIGYDYSAPQNAQHLQAWRYALRDLLLKAKAQNFALPETVYLTSDLSVSGFKGSYDYVLREGLREYGHVLADSAQDGATIFYSAQEVDKTVDVYSEAQRVYNDDAAGDDTYFKTRGYETRAFKLVIGELVDGYITRTISGAYDLPLDGYTPGTYVEDLVNPLKQKQQSHDAE